VAFRHSIPAPLGLPHPHSNLTTNYRWYRPGSYAVTEYSITVGTTQNSKLANDLHMAPSFALWSHWLIWLRVLLLSLLLQKNRDFSDNVKRLQGHLTNTKQNSATQQNEQSIW